MSEVIKPPVKPSIKQALKNNFRDIFTRPVGQYESIDGRRIGKEEKEHWVQAWQRFSKKISQASDDPLLPYLIGLAIGMARDDAFLIEFCGSEVCKGVEEAKMDLRAVIGELESVVIFMKAAVSKNRIVDKIERLFQCKGSK